VDGHWEDYGRAKRAAQNRFDTDVPATLAFVALCLAGATAVGIASYWLLERPVIASAHRFVARLTVRSPAGAAPA
jgi:peptidoglycan/LPS O-acetylase OafA/YrhL